MSIQILNKAAQVVEAASYGDGATEKSIAS